MIFKNIKKNGYTIVELMLGLSLASIVFLGALKFINSTVNTDEYQKDMINLQNESNFAISYITSDAKMSGFSISSTISTTNKQPFIWDKTLDNYEGRNNDSIKISYENFDNNTDCDGNDNLENIENMYYVDEFKNLKCNDITLIENVESFQILYGVDINNDFRADRYLKSTEASIASQNPEYTIVSLKIDLLSRNNREFGSQYEKSFNIIGHNKLTFNDMYIYRKHTRIIQLKNMG